MFDSQKELLDKIQLGEDTFLECKEVRFSGMRVTGPHRDSLADSLAALANSQGGVLVIGVEDESREIIGISLARLDLVERYVHEICQDSIDPPLSPTIERLTLPATTGQEVAVIKIDVRRGVYVHRSPGGYLHRVGSAKRVMPPDILARLFHHRNQIGVIRFDEQTVPQAQLDHLDDSLWQRFLTSRSRNQRGDFLCKLGMARMESDGSIRPTVAGVLLATLDSRVWLPNAYIQAVAYRGEEIRVEQSRDPYQIDAADIFGPLDTQVADACKFVLKNMKTSADKELGRQDRPQFDMTAVFEALVNAVAHRDYSIHGSKIRLRLFSNRLELYSPGTLPNALTIDSLPYRQSSRNDAICSLLARCTTPAKVPWLVTDRKTLMDTRGEGVRIIYDNSEALSGRLPQYRLIDDSELRLVIWAAE